MRDHTVDNVVSVYFSFEIDGVDLGTFTSCQGLGVDFNLEQHEEGGGGIFVHQMPGRFKYQNLQVSRPVGPDTTKTMLWLAKMTGFNASTNAHLAALAPDGRVVFSWILIGVIPARWTGPSFDVNQPTPATETLELAYKGFMIDVQNMSGAAQAYAAVAAAGYSMKNEDMDQRLVQGALGQAKNVF